MNASAGSAPFAAPPALARILTDSQRLSRATGGVFDPTVGPLIALWIRAGESGRLPRAAAIAEARSRVGIERISIDAAGRVTLAKGMAVNFGGVGKGWALDRMRELLAARGIANALLDFGGSSWLALGAPADAPAWRVLLRDGRGGYAGAIALRDTSVSFSESFGEWSEIEGRRYGHVIDPAHGLAHRGAARGRGARRRRRQRRGPHQGADRARRAGGPRRGGRDARRRGARDRRGGRAPREPGLPPRHRLRAAPVSDAVWRFLHRVAAGLWDARNFLLRPKIAGAACSFA